MTEVSLDLWGRIRLNPTQEEVIESRKRSLLVQGGFGSGKSVTLQGDMLSMGLDNPRSNILVIRRTMDQVLDSVVADLEEKFESHDPATRLWPKEILKGGKWDEAYHKGDRKPTLTLENGTAYHFRGVIHDGREDPKKFGSVPFAGAYIEEFSELKDPDLFNYLDGRCRQKTTPDGYNRVLLVGNPPTQSHWSQYHFIELPRYNPEVARLRGFYRLPTYENRQHLPVDYIENMEATYSKSWIKRYLQGHAGVIEEGAPILKDIFSPETKTGAPWHVSEGKLEPVPGVPILRGWDFGVAYASCIWAQLINEPHPQLIVLHEITQQQTSAHHFAPVVKVASSIMFPGHEFIDWGDPSGVNRSLADRRSPFTVLEDVHGITVKSAPTNDTEKRKDAIIDAFSRFSRGGQPFLQISNTAGTEFLRDSFESGWCYPTDSRGYIGGQRDKPVKNEWSHCADAFGYIAVALDEQQVPEYPRKRVTKYTVRKKPQQKTATWMTG